MTNPDIARFNQALPEPHRSVCELLARLIEENLPEAEGRVWHAHPVWFLADNPVVGYSRQKPGIRLMFWSGADFGEPGLDIPGRRFRDASIFFNDPSEVGASDVVRWLGKSREIQWDYAGIRKRKGRLERLR
jgi:hypothetical protein